MAFQRRWRMVGAYTSMIGATAAYLFLPKYFGEAIDQVKLMLEGGIVSFDTIFIIVGIILGLSIIRGGLSFFQTYFGEATSQFVSYDLRNRLYDHIQHLGFGFHDKGRVDDEGPSNGTAYRRAADTSASGTADHIPDRLWLPCFDSGHRRP